MLIIVDKKIPFKARQQLKSFGVLLELETDGITYEAISGHPDIFFTKIGNNLVVAPNLPEKFKQALQKHQVNFVSGEKNVGATYPETACYNAVATERFLFYNQKITDQMIIRLAAGKTLIHVNQGYIRCNLVFIIPQMAITSDPGIFKSLKRYGIEAILFDPAEVYLAGFKHGFFSGACGMHENKLVLAGNLDFHADGWMVRAFCKKAGVEIIELYDGPLYDGGGILFIDESLHTISHPAPSA
jgi:hypothetical protein